MAATESSPRSLLEQFAVVEAKIGGLKSTKATPRKDVKIRSPTYLEIGTELARDLFEARDDLRNKTGEYYAHIAQMGVLEKELVILRDVLNVIEKKIQVVYSQMAFDAKATAHLALAVKHHV